MVSAQEVDRQLKSIDADFRFWGKAEVRELQLILVPEERIMHCLNGRYEGGFAMLCATDRRLLLIDKKPFYLTLEDVRYDMISEVDYSHRLLDATLRICTVNKTLRFTSIRNAHLRSLTAYLQDRVMSVRQHQTPQPTSFVTQPPSDDSGVSELQYQAVNPFTKGSLVMRRRISRFYSN